MHTTDVILWWFLCIFSLIVLTKTVENAQTFKLVIGRSMKCIGIERRYITVHDRNHYVITLGNCKNNKPEFLWIENNGQIVSFKDDDLFGPWKLCIEFGSNTDANMFFMRAISQKLEDLNPDEISRRNRDCNNWQFQPVSGFESPNYRFPFKQYFSFTLAPTIYTTNGIANVRPGIFMIRVYKFEDGKVYVYPEDVRTLTKEFEGFRGRLNKMRAQKGLIGIQTGLMGGSVASAILFPPSVVLVPFHAANIAIAKAEWRKDHLRHQAKREEAIKEIKKSGMSVDDRGSTNFMDTLREKIEARKKDKERQSQAEDLQEVTDDKGSTGIKNWFQKKRENWRKKREEGKANEEDPLV